MRGQPRLSMRSPESGFTLVELLVTMAIASVLMSIGIYGFVNWQHTAQQQGSASALVSSLRTASERAISEGRTYCVDVSGSTSYSLWRYSCDAGGTKVAGPNTVQSNISLATVNTLPVGAACPGGHKCVYFYPRGTAVPTTVTVSSSVRSRTYVVHVEGLTARVWM
jgi:prepilin-type N-terminal cleavage/methylation domain-containing protein